MSDERTTFEQTKVRLEEILAEVKRKDTSLEHSLELLEEGVRLANQCNELIDQTSWRAVPENPTEGSGEIAAGMVQDPAAETAHAEVEPASEPQDEAVANVASQTMAPADDQRD